MERGQEKGRVLLVDDSPLAFAIVNEGLNAEGWFVVGARSGAEAIELFSQVEVEVVVCDLHMPDMGGLDVIAGLRRQGSHCPVVILSSDEDLSAVLRAVHNGAFDYVLKSSVDLRPLAAAVERAAVHYRVLVENQTLQGALERANEELAANFRELDQRNYLLQREIADRTRAQVALERARDAALAASRAKSTFLASMSHELRTPLHGIIGYCELIQEEAQDEGLDRMNADLGKIGVAARHLLSLINEILDLSKIEAGKVALSIAPYSIPALIEQAVTTIRPLAQRGQNRLEVEVDPELSGGQADSTRVRQALLNLLGNACKFTERGSIKLLVRREEIQGEPFVVFVVSDTGIGMTEDERLNLFREFYQASTTRQSKPGGTGLGLAISRRICRMMRGDIEAESALGAGSTFTMRIPEQVGETRENEAPDRILLDMSLGLVES